MSTTDHETERLNKKEEFTLYKYRFVILLVYTISCTQVSLMFGIFNPLQSTLKNVFNESITFVNFGTILISNVAFVPASFAANYIIEHFGIRIGVYMGSLLGLIGLWIRCLAGHGFAWIFIGQLLGGIAQPFFYSTPQKFSNLWFGETERAYSTTFMICVLTLGIAIGSIIPQSFIDIYADSATILSQFQEMMLFFAILGSVCFVITLILMREKPMTPPSKAAAAEKLDVSNSLRTVFRDRNTMIMLTSTAMLYGTAITYLAVAQQVSEPLGFNGNQIGDILSLAIMFCLAGAVTGAILVEKYKKYNMLVIGSSVYSLIVLCINIFGMQSRNVYFYAICVISFAFLIGPLQPISLEYGVELAFPVSEETIGGLWFVVNQLWSAIEALVIDTVIGQTPTPSDSRNVFFIMIGCQVIAIIPLFFVKQNLKRRNYESGVDFAGKEEIEGRGTFDTIKEEYHSPKLHSHKEHSDQYPL